jgi:hypothetical protein
VAEVQINIDNGMGKKMVFSGGYLKTELFKLLSGQSSKGNTFTHTLFRGSPRDLLAWGTSDKENDSKIEVALHEYPKLENLI